MPLDDLTVVITSFRRARHLQRALESCVAAGIRRVVVASTGITPEVEAVLSFWEARAKEWLSFKVARVKEDLGCNATWELGAYWSHTERVLILHDDDCLKPDFAKAYEEEISPALERGVMVTWRAEKVFDDGKTEATEYFEGPTRELPSNELWRKVVGVPVRLSLSPIVTVMDRRAVINTAKESEATLVSNDSLKHHGMLFGTEVIAYARMIQRFPKWLYLDRVLSQYGIHDGSGTVEGEKTPQGMQEHYNGYSLARQQSLKPAPVPTTRLILCHFIPEKPFPRAAAVRPSWDHQFSTGRVIEFPVRFDEVGRKSSEGMPFIRDLFDAACSFAQPEDVVAFINSDIGLTVPAFDRLINGVAKGRGVTACLRRSLVQEPGRLYQSVRNCKSDGGFDLMAVQPWWWQLNRSKMPDMVIGREAWDTVFRDIAEEWADPVRIVNGGTCHLPVFWERSAAYTDDVAYHAPHLSHWQKHRTTDEGQIHNRKLALEYFAARAYWGLCRLLIIPPPTEVLHRAARAADLDEAGAVADELDDDGVGGTRCDSGDGTEVRAESHGG